ncbi:hypothetical protein BO221_05565 [Archangium sp. Cb G35]|uniref:sensor histidine kinase n=1 Tax=Archangium sp. Cb G35 TaxID=1920190 RepID=UPI0009371C4A|nr:HAMP domain-containing sensor histidine kinase [Archangium sp. Cb G35]OJT27439.1 hypothetical protein BO221_05565 [Archangium sp. Cb G35]
MSMDNPSTPPESQRLLRAITERFGFVPPFFEPAVETPDVLSLLWQQTLTAYVDNPLPALFKEKLSTLLSRYCAVSYCLVCHSCSLGCLGMRGPQVLRLLTSPVPDEARTERILSRQSGVRTPVGEFPSPGSELEEDVLQLSSIVYLRQPSAAAAREYLLRVLGRTHYNRLVALINYVKTCHGWMEANPQVSYRMDARYQLHFEPLSAEEPGLARYFEEHLPEFARWQQEQEKAQQTAAVAAQRAEEAEATVGLLEKQLLYAMAELRRSSEFAQVLMAVVGHDLRNPLSAILSAANLLLRQQPDNRQGVKAATRIISSAQRASRLVTDLLDFTQARLGGGIPVHPTTSDIHLLVHYVVDELRAAHPTRTFEVEYHGDGAGMWDTDRLQQVLGNLLANAVVHSPEDSPIHVEARTFEGEVSVCVHNENRDGPIPAKLLPHLFEPFRRGTTAPSASRSRSIGLGLYVVERLVRAHHGRVEVESDARGTTFCMHLPRATKRDGLSQNTPPLASSGELPAH